MCGLIYKKVEECVKMVRYWDKKKMELDKCMKNNLGGTERCGVKCR